MNDFGPSFAKVLYPLWATWLAEYLMVCDRCQTKTLCNAVGILDGTNSGSEAAGLPGELPPTRSISGVLPAAMISQEVGEILLAIPNMWKWSTHFKRKSQWA